MCPFSAADVSPGNWKRERNTNKDTAMWVLVFIIGVQYSKTLYNSRRYTYMEVISKLGIQESEYRRQN
jgi:hypothetical protein